MAPCSPPTPIARSCSCEAGRGSSNWRERYYEQDDASVLPRGIATFEAFENAMTLDIAMGGSTNTVLHLLAAAQEAEVPSPWPTSTACRAASPISARWRPSSADVHVEDVHRAGGVLGILGELDRAGLVHRDVARCMRPRMGDAIERWDIVRREDPEVEQLLPRGARAASDHRTVQPGVRAIDSWTSTATRARCATSRMPSVRMAGSPCCMATSPKTAAS